MILEFGVSLAFMIYYLLRIWFELVVYCMKGFTDMASLVADFMFIIVDTSLLIASIRLMMSRLGFFLFTAFSRLLSS